MWVETKESGWVNLALVGNVRQLRVGDYQLLALNGHSLGVVSAHRDLDEWLTTEVLPAASGHVALLVTECDTGEAPSVDIQRVAVGAWRVSGFVALPVIVGDSVASNQAVFILHPDGRVLEPWNREWPDIDAARADLLADVTARWEKNRSGQAASDSHAW